MQGAGAEDSIVAALDAVADRMDDFDAVVLIRGGGSASDLNCFNAYRLCAHIAQFPLPILTGIGHDKDTSVADMVAHTALKTPTAVAGWLVERMTGVEDGSTPPHCNCVTPRRASSAAMNCGSRSSAAKSRIKAPSCSCVATNSSPAGATSFRPLSASSCGGNTHGSRPPKS